MCIVKLESKMQAGSLSQNDSIYLEKRSDAPSESKLFIPAQTWEMLRDLEFGQFNTHAASIKIVAHKRRRICFRSVSFDAAWISFGKYNIWIY